jgi:hypothetical protein
MPVPVCDRPRFPPDAIVAFVQEQAFPVLRIGETIQMPTAAIREHVRPHSTNRTPDLSIARAKIALIAAEAISELDRYSRFGAGWDGYNGEPIALAALDFARTLIEALTQAPVIARKVTEIIPGPAPDGSLDVELRTDKRRLIITMYPAPDGSGLELRTFRTDGVTSKENPNLELDALVPELRWLLA